MSSSSSAPNHSSSNRSMRPCCGKGGNWSGFNIAALVLGFVLFWPIGLVMLFWILSGRNVKDLPAGIRDQWYRMTGNWRGGSGRRVASSDNVVFNDFQEAQYDRIREIKEEIKDRASRFSAFRENARRRADEEEFNRFMNDNPGRAES